MLLGCCHCESTPSSSTPSSSSSIPSSSVPSSSSSTISTETCFCVVPRYLTFTMPAPDRGGAGACCTRYAGFHTLVYDSCPSLVSAVWKTAEYGAVNIGDTPTCTTTSTTVKKYTFQITKKLGPERYDLKLSVIGTGVIAQTLDLPAASFNCLGAFSLTLFTVVAGALQCYNTVPAVAPLIVSAA